MSTNEEVLLISISRFRNLLFRDLESIFKSNNLTSTQFSVLEVLKQKGSLNVGDIQRFVLGTSGNIPIVINNLEKEGYVTKGKLEKDNRVSMISLTKKGEKVVSKVYPLQKARLETLFENVSESDKKNLAKLLIKTYENVLDTKENAI